MNQSENQPTWKNEPLDSSLKKNVELLNRVLGVGESFDVICRQLHYAGKDFALYFVDGFVKDDVLNRIMDHLSGLEKGKLALHPIRQLLKTEIAYIEVETVDRVEKIVDSVLSGPVVLLIDGETQALSIDARTYPARNPDEPDTERVVRGSRDGFVETIVMNTALTRRRLRDPSLRMEYLQAGKRSKTDVCLAYIKDIADPDLVRTLREKIKKVDIDGLPMAEKSLEEFLFKRYWNPYPMVRYTERPDVAAVHLLEGHVLIYVDTSPSVMITPITFFHHVQHAEEYRQQPIVGAFLRWTRFIAMFSSLFLLPLWYLAAADPQLLPKSLQFFGPETKAHLPLFLQILIAEIGVEILRMASIHTPSPLATAMGLIAAILLGETAVKVGLFTSEIILYVAIAVIGTFATPSYEMGLANKIVRLILLFVTAAFHLPGLIIGTLFWIVYLARIQVLNTPYLWPVIPFNGKAFLDVLVRSPIPIKTKRPRILSPEDPDRREL
ncbi:spore germination protein [Paenactinomyces guangxiensis]|uniref:Spore germination protein n=1 Tax=Paenactinomyces guangxiensis TaxID=1490290 RepID=A0A7W1WRI4_9BACL|nr:spore germination protein [Paenactinomyces guangxiensis]MBH8591643.1 spore germination protein [Paenactinomyces guangxiensis]